MTDRYIRSRRTRAVMAQRAIQDALSNAAKAVERLQELAGDDPDGAERARLRVMAEQAEKSRYLLSELQPVPGSAAILKGSE